MIFSSGLKGRQKVGIIREATPVFFCPLWECWGATEFWEDLTVGVVKMSTAYLRVSTVDGQRRWSLMIRETPFCDEVPLSEAVNWSGRVFGKCTLRVWDADTRSFLPEVVIEPMASGRAVKRSEAQFTYRCREETNVDPFVA